jgi:hypothetical protein
MAEDNLEEMIWCQVDHIIRKGNSLLQNRKSSPLITDDNSTLKVTAGALCIVHLKIQRILDEKVPMIGWGSDSNA